MRVATVPSSRPSKRTRRAPLRNATRTAVRSRGAPPVTASESSTGWSETSRSVGPRRGTSKRGTSGSFVAARLLQLPLPDEVEAEKDVVRNTDASDVGAGVLVHRGSPHVADGE